MKYIDISQPISTNMKKYPSDPKVKINSFKSFRKGNSCNLNKLSFGSHTGTHIDAPRHLSNSANTIDNIKFKNLICNVVVLSFDVFRKKALCREINFHRIKGVLFKKGKHKKVLTAKDAVILLKDKIRIIGTEEMSIEDYKDRFHPVHRQLLSKNCVIIEGLNLKKVKSGYYKLICLPLKIKNGDGAPARAVLMDD